MKHKTSQTLYAYWNDVRNGRPAPRRFDIEPARIGPALPDTFILEHLGPGEYRFRLAGTKITERFGDGIRGSNILDGWGAADRERLDRALIDVTERGSVQSILFEACPPGGTPIEFELILLPLVHTRGAIDRILGSIAPVGEPEWHVKAPFTEKKLIDTECIWPDGRPQQSPTSIDRQSPFHPQIRNARIVRQDRRQFRVYDGGLDKPDNKI